MRPYQHRLLSTATKPPRPPRRRTFPFLRYALGTVVIGGAAFGSAAVVALNNDSFKNIWLENSQFTGGQRSLDFTQQSIDRLKATKYEDVKDAVVNSKETAERAVKDVSITVGKSLETVRSSADKAKEVVMKQVESSQQAYNSTKEVVMKQVENAQQNYNSAKDAVVNVYSKGQESVGKAVEAVNDAKTRTFETIESIQSYFFPDSHKPSPPPANEPSKPSTTKTLAQTPVTAAPAKSKTSELLPEAPAPTPKKNDPVPASEPVPEPPKPVEQTVAEKSSAVKKSSSKTIPAPEVVPEAGPVSEEVSAPIVKSDKESSKENPEDAAEKKKKRKEERKKEKEEKKAKEELVKSATKVLDSVNQQIADLKDEVDPAVIGTVRSIATFLDSLHVSKKDTKTVETTKQDFLLLSRDILAGSGSQSNASLQSQSEKHEEMLRLKMEEYERMAKSQQIELEARYQTVLDEAIKNAESQSAQQMEEQKALFQQKFQAELDEQMKQYAAELERKWDRAAKTLIDQERDNRLAKLDHLALKMKYLEKVSLDASAYSESSHSVNAQSVAVEALREIVSGRHQLPLVAQMAALKSTIYGDEVIPQILNAIPDSVVSRGVCTFASLESSFKRVSSQIRKVQLMPPRGGPLSYAASVTLSNFVLRKKGMVAGDDVEAILARSEYYMSLGELENAARELNQLKGWAKALATDWLNCARERLEVLQALDVIESHIKLRTVSMV
ncbi:Formation of crista junctions protein 1 [Blyttiomyces sp. JEL0837]|nr:Formation of crista junctions protein 1 [Blyttiomyces sp. JEL0837]